MKISYNNTKEDIKNFNIYIAKTTPAIKRNIIINTLFVPALILVTGGVLKLAPYIILTTMVLFTSLYIIVIMSTLKKQLSRIYKDNIFGERTVEITPEGVNEVLNENEKLTLWKDIKSVNQDNKNIYIFTSAYYAHIIPKKSFESSKESDEFFNTSKKYADISCETK